MSGQRQRMQIEELDLYEGCYMVYGQLLPAESHLVRGVMPTRGRPSGFVIIVNDPEDVWTKRISKYLNGRGALAVRDGTDGKMVVNCGLEGDRLWDGKFRKSSLMTLNRNLVDIYNQWRKGDHARPGYATLATGRCRSSKAATTDTRAASS